MGKKALVGGYDGKAVLGQRACKQKAADGTQIGIECHHLGDAALPPPPFG